MKKAKRSCRHFQKHGGKRGQEVEWRFPGKESKSAESLERKIEAGKEKKLCLYLTHTSGVSLSRSHSHSLSHTIGLSCALSCCSYRSDSEGPVQENPQPQIHRHLIFNHWRSPPISRQHLAAFYRDRSAEKLIQLSTKKHPESFHSMLTILTTELISENVENLTSMALRFPGKGRPVA